MFSHDLDAALRAAHRIEAGWVQVNRSGGQLPGMSYGGKKLSGLGSEYSIEGALESFTQRKGITIGIGDDPRRLGRRHRHPVGVRGGAGARRADPGRQRAGHAGRSRARAAAPS